MTRRRRVIAALGAMTGGSLAGCSDTARRSGGGGSERWTFSADASVKSAPTVAYGDVYVGSNDKKLYAIDAEDGAKRWSRRLLGRISSGPAVADSTVYVSDGTRVTAIEAGGGRKLWNALVEGEEEVYASPVVADGTVYVGSNDGNVYALDADGGAERWTFETGDPVAVSPAVAGNTVFAGNEGGTVYAIDAMEGTERWTFQTDGPVESSPAVADDTVYVGSDDDNVYALDTAARTAPQRPSGTPTVRCPPPYRVRTRCRRRSRRRPCRRPPPART